MNRNTWFRILGVMAVVGGLILVGRLTGLTDSLQRDVLQVKMQQMPIGGFLIYLGSFVFGILVGLPGLLFIGLSGYAYGKALGIGLALLAAVVALTASFALVRTIGGDALSKVQKPWVQKILARLEERPVFTVFLLRLTLVVSPPITYALALTRISYRDYVLGTTLGLVPPVVVILSFLEFFLP